MQTIPKDYPTEYIDGSVTFFGRHFVVTPAVLIPRLETESLVRRARQLLSGSPPSRGSQRGNSQSTPPSLPYSKEEGNQPTIIVDIGCGSGIIGTSVADLADEVIFLDISETALAITEKNFRTHFPEKQAQFIVSDLLSALPISYLLSPTASLLFITNLPYIKADDWIHMSADTIHEPRLALFGGEQTGFEMYERLFRELDSVKLGNCNSVKLLYEFGFDQRAIAESVLEQYPQWQSSFFADYAGIERFGEVIVLKKPELV